MENQGDKYGTSLREYKVLNLLGKGSFGSVYKVLSRKTRQIYVMKKICNLSTLNKAYRNAARAEVDNLKKLNHPHVIKLMTSFEENDCLYIIQEYAQNGDIHKIIKRQRDKEKKRIKETQLWSILYEILLGLNHMHSNNVMHRDLKPLNIFMTSTHNIKIGDLGVSKIINSSEKENQEENIDESKVGTPLYFAPELVKGKLYDLKIDLWAVGVIMYYLTALKPPFAGETIPELNESILNCSPKQLPKYYTTRYKTLIYSLLAKNPKDRPNTEEALKSIPDLIINAYNSELKFLKVREKCGAISSRESPTKNCDIPLEVIPIPIDKKIVKMDSKNLKRPISGCQRRKNSKSQKLNVRTVQATNKANIRFNLNEEKVKVYPNILNNFPISTSNNDYWKPTIDQITVEEVCPNVGSGRRVSVCDNAKKLDDTSSKEYYLIQEQIKDDNKAKRPPDRITISQKVRASSTRMKKIYPQTGFAHSPFENKFYDISKKGPVKISNDESTKATITCMKNHSNRIQKNSIDGNTLDGYNKIIDNRSTTKRILMSRRQRARPNISMLRKNESQDTQNNFFYCSCSDADSTPQTRNSLESKKASKKCNLSTVGQYKEVENHPQKTKKIHLRKAETAKFRKPHKVQRNVFQGSIKKSNMLMKTHESISRARTSGTAKSQVREKFTIKDLQD
ncbi:unnamed protein product [Moneuplotes crassus]|uniref:non-specific serine/threonine protein kinase n=1 Tax=Euplotes crassus TaxID=5936 RepID=A0AAD2DCG5_EUPCR|nr:unnamed protein product [Moneuplotes crassus]